MEKLVFSRSKSTPEISFDPLEHTLSIVGETYPENAFKFFEPLLEWVDQYIESVDANQEILITLELPYMNTSSTKCFLTLFDKFEDAFQEGKKIVLKWFYNTENENELDCAEEFKEDYSYPFEIIAKD